MSNKKEVVLLVGEVDLIIITTTIIIIITKKMFESSKFYLCSIRIAFGFIINVLFLNGFHNLQASLHSKFN